MTNPNPRLIPIMAFQAFLTAPAASAPPPGEEDAALWKYRRVWELHTSKSGADVAGTVTRFPLLLRLSGNEMDFSQAADSGRDLRFRSLSGKALPYQIAGWDARERSAAVWVLLDTVHGGRDDQGFAMLWGNRAAAPAGSGAAVFDTADGYAAAWHLDETEATGDFRDATAHGAHGRGVSLAADASIPGIAGRAVAFPGNAAKGYVAIDPAHNRRFDFSKRGDMTLAHWVRAESDPGANCATVAKGDHQWRLSRGGAANVFEFTVNNAKTQPGLKDHDLATSRTAVSPGAWRHVVGVAGAGRIRIYVNGVLEDDQPMPGKVVDSPQPVALGRNGEYADRYFRGALDEVHLLGARRSADWAKLAYENQRPAGGKLLVPRALEVSRVRPAIRSAARAPSSRSALDASPLTWIVPTGAARADAAGRRLPPVPAAVLPPERPGN